MSAARTEHLSRRVKRSPRALLLTIIAGLGLIAPLAAPAGAQAASSPAEVGAFSGLFEEGGAERPRCETQEDGNLLCKPAAVSVSVLNDGTLMYFNGIENTEGNVELTVLTEAGIVLRDSQARRLSFYGDRPEFTTLTPGINGDNPAGYSDDPVTDGLGVLGVPGRPGDGLVGSTVGTIYPAPPVAPQDDPAKNDTDMFCSDLSHLAGGQILIAGGSDFYSTAGGVPEDVPGIGGMGVSEIEGIRTAQVFDPEANTFTEIDSMKYGRWYPTLTTLPDGDINVVGGVTRLVFDSQLSNVRRTETLDAAGTPEAPATFEWSENYTSMASENSLPLYARMHLTPDGKLFYAANGQMNGFGPTGYAADEATWGLYQSFNTESAEWEIHGPTPYAGLPRNGAFSIPLMLDGDYSSMDILQGGGTLGPTPGSMIGTSLSQIITVDDESNVTTRETGQMNNARWFTTGTLLPDGTVFASGGGNIDHVNASGFEAPVRQAEIFDPETDTWTPAADMQRDRIYHNSAALLPDGRVLVGGHSPIPLGVILSHQDFGPGFANNSKDSSFEIYSPPYLFTGAERPAITKAPPAMIGWGEEFSLKTTFPNEISSISLIRQADISHTVDADARGISLPFTMNGEGGKLDIQAPPTGVTAPPGPYMLFVNREVDGVEVPSMAAMVTVGPETADADNEPARIPGYDSSAVAENGSTTPTEDSNIMEGLMTRNFPAPGAEEVVAEILEGFTPEELAVLVAPLSDEAMANFADYATPELVVNALAEMAGRDDFSQEIYDMWPEELVNMVYTDGFQEVQLAMSELIATIAGQGMTTPALPSMPEGAPAVDDLLGVTEPVGGLLGF